MAQQLPEVGQAQARRLRLCCWLGTCRLLLLLLFLLLLIFLLLRLV